MKMVKMMIEQDAEDKKSTILVLLIKDIYVFWLSCSVAPLSYQNTWTQLLNLFNSTI